MPIEVFANQALHFQPMKQARLFNGLPRQRIEQQRTQYAAKPVVRGYVETLLLAREDRLRQLVFHQAAKQEFQLRAADLQVLRQPGRKLDDAVIEERRTYLERMRHAHAVALVEDIVGQVGTLC